MNTNQRIQSTQQYEQWRAQALERHRAAVNDQQDTHYENSFPCVSDFIRLNRPYRRLRRVFYRINRGWTSRDVLIERRTPSEIPF